MRGNESIIALVEEHTPPPVGTGTIVADTSPALFKFEPLTVSLADFVAAAIAIMAFFYSQHSSATSRKLGAFDSSVLSKAQEYIELLEGQLRKLTAIVATNEDNRIQSFDKLKECYTDWLNNTDDAFSKYDSALRTWKDQYRCKDDNLIVRDVDTLFTLGNAMYMAPVTTGNDVPNDHYNRVMEELTALISNARVILTNVETSRKNKFCGLF